jgi:hypothetical protein
MGSWQDEVVKTLVKALRQISEGGEEHDTLETEAKRETKSDDALFAV